MKKTLTKKETKEKSKKFNEHLATRWQQCTTRMHVKHGEPCAVYERVTKRSQNESKDVAIRRTPPYAFVTAA